MMSTIPSARWAVQSCALSSALLLAVGCSTPATLVADGGWDSADGPGLDASEADGGGTVDAPTADARAIPSDAGPADGGAHDAAIVDADPGDDAATDDSG